MLQRCKVSLELKSGWVSASLVVEDGSFTRSRLDESGTQVNGRGDSAELLLRLVTGMDGTGVEAKVSILLVHAEVIRDRFVHSNGLLISGRLGLGRSGLLGCLLNSL